VNASSLSEGTELELPIGWAPHFGQGTIDDTMSPDYAVLLAELVKEDTDSELVKLLWERIGAGRTSTTVTSSLGTRTTGTAPALTKSPRT